MLRKKLPFSVELFSAGLFLCSYSFYSLPHWNIVPDGKFFSFDGVLLNIILVVISLGLLISSFFIPSVFNKWVRSPESMEHENAQDNYSSDQRSRNIIMFLTIFGLLSHGWLIIKWIMDSTSVYYEFSVINDIILAISVLTGIFILKKCYDVSDREIDQPVLRTLFILVRVATMLQWMVVFAGLAALWLFVGGIFPGDPLFLTDLLNIHNFLRLTLSGSLILLLILMNMSSIKPAILNAKGQKMLESEIKENFLLKIVDTGGYFLFVFLYIVCFSIILLLLIGDFIMFFSFFSLALGIGLIIPVSILLVKFGRRAMFNVQKRSLRISKIIAGIMVIITLIPLIFTPFITNEHLDAQFDQVFGSTWESEFTPQELERMRDSRYSFTQNLAGFDIETNFLYNQAYMTDFPRFIEGNDSVVIHTFYFNAHLPQDVEFGSGDEKLPVIIMMHGEVEDNGPWNANWTGQYLANVGFLVIDLNYGYVTENQHGSNNYNGYLIRDVVGQIGQLTKFLENNSHYYHADLSNTYFSGRHLGGSYALICGIGYNTTLNGTFSSLMNVRGMIPYYPIVNFGDENSTFHAIYKQKDDHPLLLGDDFISLNPIHMINKNNIPHHEIAPILIFEGTHDYLIPLESIREFKEVAEENGHALIVGEYLLGSDGFDGLHFSVWGQSILYYYERFLFLTL